MISSEVQKGLQRNFRSTKEREEFARRKRRNDYNLDRVVQRNDDADAEFSRRYQDEVAASLEEDIFELRQKGEIQGGSTKHIFSTSLPTT